MHSKRFLLVLVCAWLVPIVEGKAQPVAATIWEVVEQAVQQASIVLQAQEDLVAAQLEEARLRQSLLAPTLSFSLLPWRLESQEESTASATLALTLTLPTGTALRLSYRGSLSYQRGALQSSLEGEITQPLLIDWRLTDTALELQRAHDAVEEATQALGEAQRQATLEVLNSLAQLWVMRESVEIAQARVRLKQERLADVRNRVERGQALALNLLQVQIELRQSELALVKLQRDFALSQERLAQTFGLETTLPVQSPSVTPQLEEIVTELLTVAITPEVIAQDPRVRRAQRELVQTELIVHKARRDLLPSLGLSLSYDERLGWSLGFNVRYNLFAGQAMKLQQAEIAYTAARRKLQAIQKTVELEIVSQKNALQEAYGHLDVLKLRAELLALQQEMKEQQRERGLISASDWEEFLIQKREFENEYRAALYQLVLAYLRYKNSLAMDVSLKEVFSDESNS